MEFKKINAKEAIKQLKALEKDDDS